MSTSPITMKTSISRRSCRQSQSCGLVKLSVAGIINLRGWSWWLLSRSSHDEIQVSNANLGSFQFGITIFQNMMDTWVDLWIMTGASNYVSGILDRMPLAPYAIKFSAECIIPGFRVICTLAGTCPEYKLVTCHYGGLSGFANIRIPSMASEIYAATV